MPQHPIHVFRHLVGFSREDGWSCNKMKPIGTETLHKNRPQCRYSRECTVLPTLGRPIARSFTNSHDGCTAVGHLGHAVFT